MLLELVRNSQLVWRVPVYVLLLLLEIRKEMLGSCGQSVKFFINSVSEKVQS